ERGILPARMAAELDREERARSFQAMASMGKVMVPVEASWKAELIGQLTRFPAGKYDDGVDVCSLIGRGLEMMPAQVASSAGRAKHLVDYNPYQETWSGASGSAGNRHRVEYDPYAAAWEGEQRQFSPIDRADIQHHSEVLRRRALGLP